MSIGPVQLIVLGFDHPDFRGEIIAELERLGKNDGVRVIDALAVYKDADGELEVAHLSNVSDEQASESAGVVGALVGLGVEGEEHLEVGETAQPRTATDPASRRPGTSSTTSRATPPPPSC